MITKKLNPRDHLLSLDWEPGKYADIGLPEITQTKWLENGGDYVGWRRRKWANRVNLALERSLLWRKKRERNPDPKVSCRMKRGKNLVLEARRRERLANLYLSRKGKA